MEGIGVVGDHEPPPGPEDGKDVVAKLRLRMPRRVLIAETHHPLALHARDRFMSLAGKARLARLYLGDDDDAATSEYEIDLANRSAKVALENRIAAKAIKPCRAPLTETT